LGKTDDIWINCYSAVEEVASTPTDMTVKAILYNLMLNLLYNVGFMFTDVLDLFFPYTDKDDPDPYWYYVAYRVGDFCIRFVYRDDD
jgi:hypothetical protein